MAERFIPRSDRIKKIYESNTAPVTELLALFQGKTKIYIDYANVRPWADRLGWHVDPKRLKQFLDSFQQVDSISFYQGTLEGDARSESEMSDLINMHYVVRTKPVKIMKISVDTSSIPKDSPALLKQFIRPALLRNYDLATIEYLNEKFTEMNRREIFFIEDRKCNFDVEIGTDMLVESGLDGTETFCLWSGDSDFADPIKQLLDNGKKVVLFATARKVSKELNELKKNGLVIFEIAKIRDYICWKREIAKGTA